MLRQLLAKAGNSDLMTDALVTLIAEHSCGNPRTMMQIGSELLLNAAAGERNVLDESLYYDVYQERLGKPTKPQGKGRLR